MRKVDRAVPVGEAEPGLRGESDAQLVARCLREPATGAFSVLYQRHNALMLRVAALSLGPAYGSVVEEIAQEAWVIAYRSLARLEQPERLAAWLCRIVQRRALDHLRTQGGHERQENDAILAQVSADPTPGPDARALANERRRQLMSGIAKLPPPMARVVRHHYWLGKTVNEIAAAMGVGPSTVKSYLFRARRRLRALLMIKGVFLP